MPERRTLNQRLMGRFRSLVRVLVATGLLVVVTGCDDEIPTASGRDLFPEGARPTTIEVLLPAIEYLDVIGEFGDYTNPRDASFLIAAHEFDGSLESHVLARFTGFPDAISYTADDVSITDSTFVYGSGSVVAPIDTAATATDGPITLQLWSLAQAWDPESVSWELAVDTAGAQIPWTEPGGTRATLLAQVTRTPGDSLTQDSLVWPVDSLAVAAMADSTFPGLVVTATGRPGRIQFGRIELRTTVHPESRPDTAIAQEFTGGAQEFVFNPQEPPAPDPGSWQVGGLQGSRVLFRITLPDSVPGCAPTDPDAADCPNVPFGEVQVNEAALILDPLPVAGGFRPTAPLGLVLRIVGEPELGREAPLGGAIASRPVPARRFEEADSTVELSIARFVQSLTDDDSGDVAVALLSEPDVANFGIARFAGTPQLRILYTLPLTTTQP